MEKFENVSGVAAPMPLINIDTDMIIPKQFLKTIKRSGLGVNLFDEMRYDDNGNEIPDFVLNKPAYRKAEIIIAGDNFGCGSSREHAPWSLRDFGIKVIVSTGSFAVTVIPRWYPRQLPDASPRRFSTRRLSSAGSMRTVTPPLV